MNQDSAPRVGFGLRGLRTRHLGDYPDRTFWFWVGGVALGSVALVTALLLLAGEPGDWLPTLVAGAVVVIAARFPISVPGTKLVFSTSDVFLFGALAYLGGPPAVVLACLDATVGIFRASRRWSSRLFGPASSVIAMGVAVAAYSGIGAGGRRLGLEPAAILIGGLCAAALVQHCVNTLTVSALLASKNCQRLRPAHTLLESGWMAGVTVFSALSAAVLLVATGGVGVQPVMAAAVCVLAVSVLVNLGLKRIEAEQARQAGELAVAQEDARVNQQRFSAAFTHAAGGLAIVDGDGRVLRVNRSLCEMLDMQETALIGREFVDLVHGEDKGPLRNRLQALSTQHEGSVAVEVRLLRQGQTCWVSLHASPFEDPGASGTALIYQLHDISDRRTAQEQLQYAAYHDAMTGLPNRLAFLQRLQAAIDRSRADPSATFASLLL
ncbi:MAG: PAS domain S-box protein, partial [Rubrivivax sp.]